MKVKDLIKELMTMSQDSDVYLQIDSEEGNGYNEVSGADHQAIFSNDTMYSTIWNSGEADMSEEEWEKTKLKEKCVVLYP